MPELEAIVRDAHEDFAEADAYRIANLPRSWKRAVSTMRRRVHADAATDDGSALAARYRAWSFEILRLGDRVNYLLEEIRRDLEFPPDVSLASMMLVSKAFLHLQVELDDNTTPNGRDDREEQAYRLRHALRMLLPKFDDIVLRRFRALEFAEFAARFVRPVQSDTEVHDEIRDGDDPIFAAELIEERKQIGPIGDGVFVRASLARIDRRFETLDAAMVFEEFSAAKPANRGGRRPDGDFEVGPVRALARLAVTCEALECAERGGEGFDAAVERAYNNLLAARSRIRRELEAFQQRPPDIEKIRRR